nr:immunoglobulin light chain junction region [Macaca mulatta]MOV66081.1 immunoglobulin light chain junction region [Macaca mulatta]MOV66786.1 immunoglobulin light chain junction region [Macaca mulatta]MOV66974.1 immunoglobulin light chain junction region [Macaca mulatta]MOV67779.1 immunoglobulin light chain junction region [Macaca mulatta]
DYYCQVWDSDSKWVF